MKRMYFDKYSGQALSELHRYRAVMFSPTVCCICPMADFNEADHD